MAMNPDSTMRLILGVGAAFNAFAAAMIALPGSLGALAALPTGGSLFYRWLLVLFVALFGRAYGWLALQPVIVRPLVGLAAIGKIGVFIVAIACWSSGEIPATTLPPAVGDLAFAGVFVWWLRATR